MKKNPGSMLVLYQELLAILYEENPGITRCVQLTS